MTEYRRYQGKSYMVYKREVAEMGYEYPMLLKNQIAGLLSVWMIHTDENMEFWFDISGMHSLENWMKLKKPGGEFLKVFMKSLADVLERTGEYLLCEEGISLLADRIFVNSDGTEISFCYLPFEKVVLADSLRKFMEYYLSHMEHGNGESVQRCYEVYESCQKEHIKVEELLAILFEGEMEEKIQTQEPLQGEKEPMIQEVLWKQPKEKKMGFLTNVKNLRVLPKRKKMPEPSYIFEPETTQEENTNPTVFLGSETEQILGELRYEGEERGENFRIDALEFLVGSQKDGVDAVILDETVSRMHARITVEDGAYYLEDMNSTNGTYLNGELLNYMEKVLLNKNDKIEFAKVKYRFV